MVRSSKKRKKKIENGQRFFRSSVKIHTLGATGKYVHVCDVAMKEIKKEPKEQIKKILFTYIQMTTRMKVEMRSTKMCNTMKRTRISLSTQLYHTVVELTCFDRLLELFHSFADCLHTCSPLRHITFHPERHCTTQLFFSRFTQKH